MAPNSASGPRSKCGIRIPIRARAPQPSGCHMGFSSKKYAISGVFYLTAGSHPILKPAEVAHIGVAEVLEGLTGEGGTNTGAAIDQDRLLPLERRIMGR